MVATVQKIPLKGLIVDIVLSILGACKLGAQIKDLYMCVCVDEKFKFFEFKFLWKMVATVQKIPLKGLKIT